MRVIWPCGEVWARALCITVVPTPGARFVSFTLASDAWISVTSAITVGNDQGSSGQFMIGWRKDDRTLGMCAELIMATCPS